MDGRPGNIPPVQRQARRARQTREAPQRVPKAVALILGAALPDLPPAGLRGLCLRWETALAPRLAPEQMAHIRRFAPDGPALAARASRLLARLLLRGLQSLGALRPDLCLERDMAGRPLLSGWRISFSHSGRAARPRRRGPLRTGRQKKRPATRCDAGPSKKPCSRRWGWGSAMTRP